MYLRAKMDVQGFKKTLARIMLMTHGISWPCLFWAGGALSLVFSGVFLLLVPRSPLPPNAHEM